MSDKRLIHPVFLKEEVVGKKEFSLFGTAAVCFDQPSLPISKEEAHGFILVENIKEQTFDYVPFMVVARVDTLDVRDMLPYLDRQVLAIGIENHYASIINSNTFHAGQVFIKKDTSVGGRSFFSKELFGHMVHF